MSLFSQPRNDSRFLEVMEEEKDEDLFDEDDLEEEDDTEKPPPVEYSVRGEELLVKFQLKGERAEQVGDASRVYGVINKQINRMSVMLDETINHSKLGLTRGFHNRLGLAKDEPVLRPSTPLKSMYSGHQRKYDEAVKSHNEYNL